jgi:DNA invertase Pin-like site-specific DNA recombinase
VVDLYELLEEFRAAGVAFLSVSEGVDTSSAVGEFIMGVLAALAQMERKLIGERTRDTLAHKKANGEHVGRVPFGYRVGADGKLEKDPDQQKVIARIKRQHRNGRSIRAISERENVPKSTVHAVINDHLRSRNAKYAA